MKVEGVIGILLITGIIISMLVKTYLGIALVALGIPLYLAYVAREQNILAKSRLYDRDLFLMTGIAVVVIVVFNYLCDPRIGLVSLAFVVPLLALYSDRLKGRKKVQNT